MKLGVVKRISRDDLAKAGGEMPKWLDALLDPLNDFIEKVGLGLLNRLSFRDNFLGKVVELKFTHDIEQEINPYPDNRGSLRVTGVLPVSTGEAFIEAFKWTQKQNGNIGVTVRFSGTTEATVRLHVHLE
jgi:hypothetical protein